MPTSFISFNDKVGFWVPDGYLEITCSYIVQKIENSEMEVPIWLREMKELIEQNSWGYFTGHMHLSLPEYLHNEERKNEFLRVLEETRKTIISKEGEISASELNSFIVHPKTQRHFKDALETAPLLKVIDFLILVIKGDINILPGDPIDYW